MSTATEQPLICTVSDGVATLTLNRPAARNALSAELKEALAEAVPRLVANTEVRAIVLTGAGGVFCAGGDLRAMVQARPGMTIEGWRARMADVHPWVRQLIELDRPLIAAVDGAAFGAGFSLALAADFVLATPSTRLCMSFMRVGLVPDFGALYTLPRIVGVQRAKELMLSAREVAADEALRLGLVMEVLPPEQLMSRAMALAKSFAGASSLAVSLTKQALAGATAGDVGQSLAQEAAYQALCFSSQPHEQAVQRFLDKQPAAFQWPAAPRG